MRRIIQCVAIAAVLVAAYAAVPRHARGAAITDADWARIEDSSPAHTGR